MFWLRKKKTNFQLRTLIWRSAVLNQKLLFIFIQMYVMGTLKNRLNETVLLSFQLMSKKNKYGQIIALADLYHKPAYMY